MGLSAGHGLKPSANRLTDPVMLCLTKSLEGFSRLAALLCCQRFSPDVTNIVKLIQKCVKLTC